MCLDIKYSGKGIKKLTDTQRLSDCQNKLAISSIYNGAKKNNHMKHGTNV